MDPSENNLEAKELIDLAERYGIQLADSQARLLIDHLSLVVETNKVINLTRIVDEHEALSLHILDSLLLAPRLQEAPSGRFIDIGTGAGYPGIPLAVATGRRAVLVDSVGKKVSAVQGFVKELELENQITAKHIRVEDLAKRETGAYSAVVARAVAKLNVLIEYAAPLLCKSGLLIVTKANPDDSEIHAGNTAARICGLEPMSLDVFNLPEHLGHREILTYKKVRKSEIRLPRKVGMATRKPLGE